MDVKAQGKSRLILEVAVVIGGGQALFRPLRGSRRGVRAGHRRGADYTFLTAGVGQNGGIRIRAAIRGR
jgi:hypothetical protein